MKRSVTYVQGASPVTLSSSVRVSSDGMLDRIEVTVSANAGFGFSSAVTLSVSVTQSGGGGDAFYVARSVPLLSGIAGPFVVQLTFPVWEMVHAGDNVTVTLDSSLAGTVVNCVMGVSVRPPFWHAGKQALKVVPTSNVA